MEKLKKYINTWQPADYLLACLLIVFPVYNKLLPSLLILIGLTLIWQRNYLSKAKRNLFSPLSPFLWSIILFLIHLIGVSYSSNVEEAWLDVGMKFSLLALPVLFLFVRLNITQRQVLDIYLFTLISTSIGLLIFASYRTIYLPHSYPYRFFIASDFCYTMHRSYYAMYASTGVLIAIYRLFVDRKLTNVLWAAFLFIVTVLTMSKAGLLILLLFLPFLLVYLALKIFNTKIMLISLVALFSISAIVFWQGSTLRNRFGAMLSASNVSTENNNSTEGNNVRVIMWSTSSKLIKENLLLGVGTGDVNDELNRRNHLLGNHAAAEHNFNSHNQYLNTFVAIGIFGFISLLFFFLSAIYLGLRRRNIQLIAFSTVFALSLLFESMFETQAGLIPIVLMILVLSTVNPDLSKA